MIEGSRRLRHSRCLAGIFRTTERARGYQQRGRRPPPLQIRTTRGAFVKDKSGVRRLLSGFPIEMCQLKFSARAAACPPGERVRRLLFIAKTAVLSLHFWQGDLGGSAGSECSKFQAPRSYDFMRTAGTNFIEPQIRLVNLSSLAFGTPRRPAKELLPKRSYDSQRRTRVDWWLLAPPVAAASLGDVGQSKASFSCYSRLRACDKSAVLRAQ
jgi:hypothetical protein